MEKEGSLTELSSIFPAEEAQKASRRVQDAIAERQQQLNQLKGFIEDNVNLINLVQRLPDETHHDIMVLLGEGYYAERTSKQTVEILKRRGKTLETQTKSVKAIMQDLKAEASFFDATANESAEGLVEIREDYVEEGSSGTSTTTGAGHRKSDTIPPHEVDCGEAAVEDEEYNRIFSRMAELEREEEEAEKDNESDEDEQIQNEQDSPAKQIFTDQEIRSLLVEETSEAPPVSKGEQLSRVVASF